LRALRAALSPAPVAPVVPQPQRTLSDRAALAGSLTLSETLIVPQEILSFVFHPSSATERSEAQGT